MAGKDKLKDTIVKIIQENPDKSLADLFKEHKEFSQVVNDEELSKFVVKTYEQIHSKDSAINNAEPKQKQENKNHQQTMTQNENDLVQLIKEQQKIILDQQKKIQDHDQKLNDIINIFQTFMSNPNALLEMVGGTPEQAQQPQGQKEQTEQQPQQSQQQTQMNQQAMLQQKQQAMNVLKSTAASGSPFDFNKLQDVLKSVAIITSNIGQPKQQASPMDIIGNITNSVDIATTIASSIGEGLGKLFDTFNKMQDRAFKSWALKSKAGAAEEEIEKLLEHKLDEKLNSIINRGGGK